MISIRPGIVLGAAAALLGLVAAARADMERSSVAIPSPIVDFAAEYIAEDLFYAEQGLAVTSMGIAGVGAMNAVISGSVDFSLSSGGSIDRAAARGQRLVAIASLGNTAGEFAVLRKDLADAASFDANAPIATRAKILRGHSFGIGGINTIGDAFLRAVAKAGGVDPQSLVLAAMQPPDIIAAMSRRALDGFSLGTPWAQQAAHDGLAIIVASAVDGDPPGYVPLASALLVTRPQFCAAHRSICVKMGHSLALAVNYMAQHPHEAQRVLQRHFPTIDAAVMAAAFAAVMKMTPNPPVPDALELENADRLNVDVGLHQAGGQAAVL